MDIFEGSLKKRNVQHRPVEWESGDFKLGLVEDTGMHTSVNLRIPLLTVEWPSPVLMITFKNKNFVFARTWPDDIDELADWLKLKAQEARDNEKSLENKSGQMQLLKQAATAAQDETPNALMQQLLSQAGMPDLSQTMLGNILQSDDNPLDMS